MCVCNVGYEDSSGSCAPCETGETPTSYGALHMVPVLVEGCLALLYVDVTLAVLQQASTRRRRARATALSARQVRMGDMTRPHTPPSFLTWRTLFPCLDEIPALL